ncbi:hypothetical protein BJL95_16050 [Methylomonas sp. LWB]|uniref:hypothetical protein n=1 Tax=Methylomonas sp. LWB TaxID=1905845 RepID=UPI00091CB043|nr:hypothetical protein [Methylomonas sp. LWB]OHX35726.1 hypothetical protein BJL95_16050 [Methylomonas sp. LWB]
MNISEAVRIINNLDYEEGLKRKFAPQHSLMQLDRNGDIVAIYRFKKSPTEEEQVEALKKHRGTVQIPAMPGMFDTVAALQARISKSMPVFSSLSPIGSG